jgi:hypothetical protein
MCTIITLFRVHPAFPLVIAANRDEKYARPSSGPALLAAPRAVVAGRDLNFGGTWFGINAHGIAVAVADQGLGGRPPQPRNSVASPVSPPQPPNSGGSLALPHRFPNSEGSLVEDGDGARALSSTGDATGTGRRSRGLLVLDALGCASVDAVGDLLGGVRSADYNPFTLLHADRDAARIGRHTDGPVEVRALVPGVDVMVSAIGADHARWRSEYVVGALDVAKLAALEAPALCAALQAVLRHHAAAGSRDDAICRHRDDSGTVSSFVALLGPDLAMSQLHCALGAPCCAHYVDYSHLLRELATTRV